MMILMVLRVRSELKETKKTRRSDFIYNGRRTDHSRFSPPSPPPPQNNDIDALQPSRAVQPYLVIKMSARLTNRLLKAVVSAEKQLQEQQLGGGGDKNKRISKKDGSKYSKKRERKKSVAATDDGARDDPATAHLNAILQFDEAIERYFSNGERSLKRKVKDNEIMTKRRKKARQADISGAGSARSNSGPSLKLEPTFNKRRAAKKLEAKRLADLARALKRGVKKK